MEIVTRNSSMHDSPDKIAQVRLWTGKGLLDPAAIRSRLPVQEVCFTQTGCGLLPSGTEILFLGEVTIFRSTVGAPCIGLTTPEPGYVGFVLPIGWHGEYVINGVTASISTLYAHMTDTSVYVRSGPRTTISVIVRRDRFIETIAALRGVDPDDVTINDQLRELRVFERDRIRRKLSAIIDESCTGTGNRESGDVASEIFGLIFDVYLNSDRTAGRDVSNFRQAQRIIRAAEERFAAAQADPVSLADLCKAARVGKSTLYKAFNSIVGEPPLRYFKKRRLTRARSLLLRSTSQRGAVKNAALSVGLTELGRFSAEYRQLIGESPSVTLSKTSAF